MAAENTTKPEGLYNELPSWFDKMYTKFILKIMKFLLPLLAFFGFKNETETEEE